MKQTAQEKALTLLAEMLPWFCSGGIANESKRADRMRDGFQRRMEAILEQAQVEGQKQ